MHTPGSTSWSTPEASVTIVRHPQSVHNSSGLWAGWVDSPLTEYGRQQADEAARLWRGAGLSLVVSSDLSRASDAADRIAAACGAERRSDSAWRERQAGEWQGRPVAEIDDPLLELWRHDQRVCPPAGEPYQMFEGRLMAALRLMLARGGRTLVVAHGGVLDLLGRLLVGPDAEGWRPRPLLDGIRVGYGLDAALIAVDSAGSGFSSDGSASVLSAETSEELFSQTQCHSCHVAAGGRADDVVWRGKYTLLNHTGDEGRDGWFVASPARHVRQPHQLDEKEAAELWRLLAAADRALSTCLGSTRNMIATLGWKVADHLHVHVVPTFNSRVTFGSYNFDDAYRPYAEGRDAAVVKMREALQELV